MNPETHLNQTNDAAIVRLATAPHYNPANEKLILEMLEFPAEHKMPGKIMEDTPNNVQQPAPEASEIKIWLDVEVLIALTTAEHIKFGPESEYDAHPYYIGIFDNTFPVFVRHGSGAVWADYGPTRPVLDKDTHASFEVAIDNHRTRWNVSMENEEDLKRSPILSELDRYNILAENMRRVLKLYTSDTALSLSFLHDRDGNYQYRYSG
jgi:hypothetical protein